MRFLARFAFLCAGLFAAPALFAQEGSNAYAAGVEDNQNQRWDQAIQDFNLAIQQNPNYAEAYSGRACAKWSKRDINGALADLSKSISIEPKYGILTMRGEIRYHSKWNNKGAMADFDRELFLYSSDTKARYDRGNLKQFEGDVQGAINDYSACLGYGDGLAYQWRGYAEAELYLTGTDEAGSNSIRDLQKAIELNPTDQDDPHFCIWFVRAKDPAQTDAATQDLSDYMATRPGQSTDWANDIGNYLEGNISEDNFIEKIGASPDGKYSPRADEFFYVGIKHLYSGDAKGATTFFQRAVKQGGAHGSETDAAQYWLTHAAAPPPAP